MCGVGTTEGEAVRDVLGPVDNLEINVKLNECLPVLFEFQALFLELLGGKFAGFALPGQGCDHLDQAQCGTTQQVWTREPAPH